MEGTQDAKTQRQVEGSSGGPGPWTGEQARSKDSKEEGAVTLTRRLEDFPQEAVLRLCFEEQTGV